jgi:hypothetical protein
VRSLFLKDDDTPKSVVEALQKAPYDANLQSKLKGILEDKADENEALAKILEEMAKTIAEKMKNEGSTTNNTSTITGDKNTVVQSVKDSTINIGNITQHHSGTGDNVAGDKHETNNFYGNKKLSGEKEAVWQEMLKRGALNDAIEYLMQQHKGDNAQYNMLILLLSRYARNEAEANKGTISKNEADLERNKISNALLETFARD